MPGEDGAVARVVAGRVPEVLGDRLVRAERFQPDNQIVREVITEAPAVAVGCAAEEEAGSAATVEGVARQDAAASVVDEEGAKMQVEPVAGQAVGHVGHPLAV